MIPQCPKIKFKWADKDLHNLLCPPLPAPFLPILPQLGCLQLAQPGAHFHGFVTLFLLSSRPGMSFCFFPQSHYMAEGFTQK
jgi:hypothetical protein